MVISTDIRDLLQFVDRVVALRGGRIVADLPAGETSYAQMLDLTVGALGAVRVMAAPTNVPLPARSPKEATEPGRRGCAAASSTSATSTSTPSGRSW